MQKKDKARQWTDKKLEQMEKDLRKTYSTATKELKDKWKDYMQTQNAYIKDLQDAYYTAKRAGFDAEAKELGKQLGIAKRDRTVYNDHYKEMVEETTKKLANVNQMALNYVNGQMPSVYVQNYNEAYNIAENIGMKFSLINDKVVNKMVADGDIKLPKKKIDIPKDMRWNTKQLNSSVLQGIIQGETMDQIANRILPVVNSNAVSAIRNARTMVTGAENRGRLDSYKNLEERGAVVKKVWMATPDDRTRESHIYLDGQEVEVDEPFTDLDGNELMYPADPDADPSTVYNCRCTMITHITGFRRADGTISEIDYEGEETLHDQQMQEEKERRQEEENKNTNTDDKTLIDGLRASYDSHAELNNLRVVESAKLNDDFFGGDLSKLSDESANAFTNTLNTLMGEYDTPLNNVRLMSGKEALGNSAFATTRHNYSTDTAQMLINPLKCRDAEKLTEKLNELMDKGYAVKVRNPLKYIPTHEFAHSLFNVGEKLQNSQNFVNADYAKIREVRSKVHAVYEKYINEVDQLTKNAKKHELDAILNASESSAQKAREAFAELSKVKISNYSLVSEDEFIAEAFTHYRLADTPNAYAEEIGGIIDNYFKRG